MKRVFMLMVTGVVLFVAVQAFGQEEEAQTSSSTVQAKAVVPRLVRFSGTVREASGKPVHGVADVTFSLYREDAGGDPLWFETQTVEVDAQGRYNVLLGAMHPDGLPMDLFISGEARWLGIMVGKSEQPRVLLVSVPYALKAADAESLGGKPATAYVASDQLKDQVQSEMKTQLADPKIGLRSVEMMVTNPGATPTLINETVPATFTCSSSSNCITTTQAGTGHATFSHAQGTTGLTYGVYGQSSSASGRGVFGYASSATGTTFGVRGLTDSTGGYGTYGVAGAATGFTFGARGDSASSDGRGIYGFATSATGVTYGVLGTASSTTGIGLAGTATAVSGNTIGVRAVNNSPTGVAAQFDALGGGKIISGRTTSFVEKFSVASNGNVVTAGSVQASSFLGSGVLVSGTVIGSQMASTVATGTAPLAVSSTTQVNNLNASFLQGLAASYFQPKTAHGIQEFFGNETFVVPANVTHLMVEMWGAGGGGGPSTGCDTVPSNGGGGGGGAYTRGVIEVIPGDTYDIVVGAGGTAGGGDGGDSQVKDENLTVLIFTGGGEGGAAGGVSGAGGLADPNAAISHAGLVEGAVGYGGGPWLDNAIFAMNIGGGGGAGCGYGVDNSGLSGGPGYILLTW